MYKRQVEYTPHVLHSVVARDGQGDAYTFEPKKRLTVELKNQDSQMLSLIHISAVSSFSAATQDASYATPYKAYLGLGSALEKLGNLTEAGVAYRQAAIDGTNPAPAGEMCIRDRPSAMITSSRVSCSSAARSRSSA